MSTFTTVVATTFILAQGAVIAALSYNAFEQDMALNNLTYKVNQIDLNLSVSLLSSELVTKLSNRVREQDEAINNVLELSNLRHGVSK